MPETTTLTRATNIGSKKVIFMIVHENDLDFMLPVILYCSNPIVFFWGILPDNDFRVKILEEHGVKPIALKGLYFSLFERIRIKIVQLLAKRNYNSYCQSLRKKHLPLLAGSLQKHLGHIEPDTVNNVVFDHTVNDTAEMLIGVLRRWKPQSLNIIALPHSYGVVSNRMTKYSLLKPAAKNNWDIFDKFVSFNEHQSSLYDISESKKEVIPSLRNTTEWADFLGKKNHGLNGPLPSSTKRNGKIRLLIIHNRIASNINYNELLRCIKILDATGCFDVRIKPHPRRIGDALALAEKFESVTLIREHILECVRWSDFVYFFHSSAVYDAILLNRPILYPKFASSNVIDPNVAKYCNTLLSPDDFYHIVNKIIKKQDVVKPCFTPPPWNDLVEKWASLIN